MDALLLDTQIIVIVAAQKEAVKTLGDIMEEWEREELLIRMDERIKTIYNRMDKFETLFTNHLNHHEMWENDIKTSLQRWLAVIVTAGGGVGALGMM